MVGVDSDRRVLNIRCICVLAIRYPNEVINSPSGNLDICLNYYANDYLRWRNSVRVLSVADHNQR